MIPTESFGSQADRSLLHSRIGAFVEIELGTYVVAKQSIEDGQSDGLGR